MTRLLVVLLALLVCAPAALAASAQDDLAQLNAQRAQQGLPAQIAENPAWSAACDQHISYMATTGIVAHAEDPAQPAFTDLGNWAGTNSVLAWSGGADGSGWTTTANPFEFAPLHLSQLLAPQLATVGVADRGGFACMTTWPGSTRPAPAVTRIVTYPGHGAGIYASETSDEWPYTPASRLGLPNPTGPHLFAFAWGRDAAETSPLLARASLTGPAGPVDIRTADTGTPGIGEYLPVGAAIVIPVAPLTPGATYTASVAFTDGSTHTWSFTALDGTATTPAARAPLTLRVQPAARRGTTLRRYAVSVTGQAPAPGERVRVRIGRARATLIADAEGWFAGVLRVKVRPRAHAVRLVLRDTAGTTAQRVALSA